MDQRMGALIKLSVSMLIFGSIGLFVRYIPLDSSLIALVRAVVGVVFLLTVLVCKKAPISRQAIKGNFLYLCVSGIAIGFNWILLFESYRYTSVAVSTLCYYMAPILVILFSPVVLKEKLTAKKLLCIAAAVAGMACISGIMQSGIPGAGELKGILLGLGAAVLYASVILLNKQLKGIGAFDRTIMQLLIAGAILVPYNLLVCDFSSVSLTLPTVLLLAVVGIIHTGFAYFLYFGSMEHLSGQSIAIASYIDPVVAVIASVVILGEAFSLYDGIGALLILGAAVVSDLPGRRKGRGS